MGMRNALNKVNKIKNDAVVDEYEHLLVAWKVFEAGEVPAP